MTSVFTAVDSKFSGRARALHYLNFLFLFAEHVYRLITIHRSFLFCFSSFSALPNSLDDLISISFLYDLI